MHVQLKQFNDKILHRDWLMKQISFTKIRDVNQSMRFKCYQVNHMRILTSETKLEHLYDFTYSTLCGIFVRYSPFSYQTFNDTHFEINGKIILHKTIKCNNDHFDNRDIDMTGLSFTFEGTKIKDDLYKDVIITIY